MGQPGFCASFLPENESHYLHKDANARVSQTGIAPGECLINTPRSARQV